MATKKNASHLSEHFFRQNILLLFIDEFINRVNWNSLFLGMKWFTYFSYKKRFINAITSLHLLQKKIEKIFMKTLCSMKSYAVLNTHAKVYSLIKSLHRIQFPDKIWCVKLQSFHISLYLTHFTISSNFSCWINSHLGSDWQYYFNIPMNFPLVWPCVAHSCVVKIENRLFRHHRCHCHHINFESEPDLELKGHRG